jgi:hypothetical protein
MKKFISVGLTLLLTLAFVGCSKPPEMEMSAAQSALDAARSAQADVFDSATFMMASDTLNAAMAAKLEQDGKSGMSRNYDAAKVLFVRAKELADQSVAQAAVAREEMRAEIANMLVNVKVEIETVKGTIPAKGNMAEIEGWKNMLSNAEVDIAAADSELNAGNITQAKTKLNGAMKAAKMVAYQITAFNAPKMPVKSAAPAKKAAKKK